MFKGAPPEALYRKIEGYISLQVEADEPKPVYLDPVKNIKLLNDELLEGQIAYHKKASIKMKHLEKLLEDRGKFLNYAAIFLVCLDLVILFFALCFPDNTLEESYPMLYEAHEYATPVFICLTAIFPALVAAFNAIRFQSEAKKLEERYSTMRKLLADLKHKIGKLLPNENGSDIIDYFKAISEVEQIMLDEVSDWSLLYSKGIFES